MTSHGVEPRGLMNVPRTRSYDGRFGRMFQQLPPAHDPTSLEHETELRAIADSMLDDGAAVGDNPRIPAGYVYLGQFVDHDVTFDPTSQLQRRNDPDGLINFRTPRFDLDSVYGSGPSDEPFQYDGASGVPDSGFRLLLTPDNLDMPRNVNQRALIGDPRNDENGIVSQLHVAFLKFHNRLMDNLAGEFPIPSDCFPEAQRSAQWHYQWVVAHDFLRRIIGDDLHTSLITTTTEEAEGPREVVRLRHYRHKKNPYLPVEFSVAAYRSGHSQVRDFYSINNTFARRLFDPSGDDFRGFQALRQGWQASWPHFFKLDETPPQLSRSIDSSLAPTLMTLQGGSGDTATSHCATSCGGLPLGCPLGRQSRPRWARSPSPTKNSHQPRPVTRHSGSTCCGRRRCRQAVSTSDPSAVASWGRRCLACFVPIRSPTCRSSGQPDLTAAVRTGLPHAARHPVCSSWSNGLPKGPLPPFRRNLGGVSRLLAWPRID